MGSETVAANGAGGVEGRDPPRLPTDPPPPLPRDAPRLAGPGESGRGTAARPPPLVATGAASSRETGADATTTTGAGGGTKGAKGVPFAVSVK